MPEFDEPSLPVVQEAKPIAWTPSFAVGVDQMVERVEAKHEFFKRVMRKDEHYGQIPGTNSKPTLYKPGAELLLASMGLFVELSDAEEPVRDYGGEGADNHEGTIIYRRRARIYRQTGVGENDRMLVAQAEGFCTSRESKHRWREAKPRCPECGKAAVIRGKTEYGGGWLCWKKKDGCGATWTDAEAKGLFGDLGKVPNPDLADSENTILKMADKRALVAATLIATGCSDIFTQDIEESDSEPAGEPPSVPAPSRPMRTHKARQKPGEPQETPSKWADPTPISAENRRQVEHFVENCRLTPTEVELLLDSGLHITSVAELKTNGEARRAYAMLIEAEKEVQREIPL